MMNQSVHIRRCSVDDAPALSVLARRIFADTFTGTCTEADLQHFLDTVYSEPQLRLELADPADQVYFALVDDQPAGYIRFGENPVPFPHDASLRALELNRLYVDRAYQGAGVARQLMALYERYAQENGCRLLWLGVWEHNYRAQAFYKKYGFQCSGYRHPFPIGDTPQTDEWWIRIVD